MNRKRSVLSLMFFMMLVLILVLSSTSLGFAQDSDRSGYGLTAVPDAAALSSTYINQAEKSISPDGPELDGISVDGLRAVSVIVTLDESVNVDQLAAAVGAEIIHRYKTVFNGASFVLSGDKVDDLSEQSGVTGIYLDELRQLDTEVSPDFIGAPVLWDSLGGQESAGEGVIVGILDSGIWPEHPSVSDPDPFGNPFPAPPTLPGSNGFAGAPRSTCDFGNTAYNPNDAPFTCNNKLIGAYSFIDTYKAIRGLLPEEFDSARDDNGHGTHTATTAAGNGGVESSIFGVPRGTISGIAPRAHVIAYRVCGDTGCYSSDSAAAVEQAILDDVDSINFSISGGGSPYTDMVELAFSRAYESGVFVSASAGNAGPTPDTVAHRGPWTMTVGASTSDRHFLSTVTLEADDGDTLVLEGATVTDGIATSTPVVFPPTDELCLNPYPTGTFSGEIVICERGTIARVAKSFNVGAGGAGGLLLYNPVNQGLSTDNHFIPSVHLEGDDGVDLLDFMDTHTGVTGTFTPGTATTVQGDKMAAFSSRGGLGQTLGVGKPDITAPGVQILAGHTPLPATVDGGLPGELFQSIQGTSMSSPHIAGAGALVKALHPDWTPGQIKSALMTTALVAGVTKEDGVTPADAFDFGSGRVDLSKAGDPGITISDTTANYMALETELWNANYPSLFIPNMPGITTVQRTLHSELSKSAWWTTSVESPDDLIISVQRRVYLRPGWEKTINITVDASHVPLGEARFAVLQFHYGDYNVRFPITIVRGQPALSNAIECATDPLSLLETTDCNITVTNSGFSDVDYELRSAMDPWRRSKVFIVPGSVTGADDYGWLWLKKGGTMPAAQPPLVNVAVDPLASPFGYVGLDGFGSTTEIGATDESIANFTIPSFEYAGETYDSIGIVSNGYIVVGGGTGADVLFINSSLPDAAIPNNVLAPFWTDLNPAFGGRLLINVLTNGTDTWTVVEWESVRSYGDVETTTAQVWIGTNTDANPGEDISFVYGADVSDGDGGLLTVGAENKYGNSGGVVYYNGVGTPPAPSSSGFEVDVFSVPGATTSYTIDFSIKAKRLGEWANCVDMTSSSFQGVNVACEFGEVIP